MAEMCGEDIAMTEKTTRRKKKLPQIKCENPQKTKGEKTA
jgi:hypothetical protein